MKKSISRIKWDPQYYQNYMVIGWREWVALPDLGISTIKAKIDTGAKTSALHAFDIEEFKKRGKSYVRFNVHPQQKSKKGSIKCEAEVIEWRNVKNSGGKVTHRPVILTQLEIGGWSWDIELTLVNRDQMGFRMLLGREALRGHLLVHSGGSYLISEKKSGRSKV